jgi:hypothetical protein
MKTKPIAARTQPCSSPLTSAQPANTSDGGGTNENWSTDNNQVINMAPTFTIGLTFAGYRWLMPNSGLAGNWETRATRML